MESFEEQERKRVLVESEQEYGEILSPIFLRAKLDGSHRLILNLKRPNKFITKLHFKMETINSILNLITPGCFMKSIDLKDAYYSVKIQEDHQKFLKFKFENCLYKFTALPNGLSSGPRKFTKLLKPPLASLRKQGHTIATYIDDLINIAITYNDCVRNVIDTIILFNKLRFVIHPKKSHMLPSNKITFLGLDIDSVTMTLQLTKEKKDKILENFPY